MEGMRATLTPRGYVLGKHHEGWIEPPNVGDEEGHRNRDARSAPDQQQCDPMPVPPHRVEQGRGEQEELRVGGQIPGLEHAHAVRAEVVVHVQDVQPPALPAAALLQLHPLRPQRAVAQPGQPGRVQRDDGEVGRRQPHVPEQIEQPEVEPALALVQLEQQQPGEEEPAEQQERVDQQGRVEQEGVLQQPALLAEEGRIEQRPAGHKHERVAAEYEHHRERLDAVDAAQPVIVLGQLGQLAQVLHRREGTQHRHCTGRPLLRRALASRTATTTTVVQCAEHHHQHKHGQHAGGHDLQPIVAAGQARAHLTDGVAHRVAARARQQSGRLARTAAGRHTDAPPHREAGAVARLVVIAARRLLQPEAVQRDLRQTVLRPDRGHPLAHRHTLVVAAEMVPCAELDRFRIGLPIR
uniref:Uncharacterized protein n=1 Tax=Anopheles merus TaxID=30066 RepID=A0A182VI68_ANOME